jgi:hypothetical protein
MKLQETLEASAKLIWDQLRWSNHEIGQRWIDRISNNARDLEQIAENFAPADAIAGEPVDACNKCELEIFVRPTVDNPHRYIKRQRWATFSEVFRAMHAAMDLQQCEKCGERTKRQDWRKRKPCKCGGEWFDMIDEYDSGPGSNAEHNDREIAFPWEHVREIACFANVGGNEGYFATAAVIVKSSNYSSFDSSRYIPLYWIKSFRGMDHAWDLARLMAEALGANG